ncbi:MAG TPA: MFS transporter [Iamia sp.]|nr:MFS transporter [Iamia sp.]
MTLDATATEPDAPPGRLVTPTFVLITVAALGYFTALGMHLPVLPRYVEDELGGSGVAVGAAVGAFAVSAALVRPAVGRLGDTLGRRPLAVVGAAVAAVSILGYGLVESLPVLIGFRLLTGLGEAAFFVGVATAAQDLSPDDRRGEAASFFSTAIYGGLAIGPFLGEVLYRNGGAGRVWLVSAVLAAVAAAVALLIPRDLGKQAPKTLVEGEVVDADEGSGHGFLHPAAVMPGTILLLGLMGFAAFSSFLAIHLDDLGIEDAGPYFLLYGVAVLVMRVLGARVPDRFGAVRTTTLSLVAIAVGSLLIAAVDAAPAIAAGTLVFSVGMSLLFPALFGLTVNTAPAAERSHAVGTFSLFFDLSQGVGAPVLGVVVDLVGSDRAAFVTAAAIALVGLVVARARLPRPA